jgi:gliding motility-associated-like protein
VQATGGVAPYQYSLGAGPFSFNNQFNNLSAGTYTVHVKDANGGTVSINVTVNDIAGPMIISVMATPTSCTAENGTITVNAQNGATPLEYSIDGVNFQTASVFNGIAGGTYTATAKDANGCIATSSVTVALNNTITANAGANTAICEGQIVTLSASSNGTNFSWSPIIGLSNPNILSPVASPVSTTDYTLTATSGACTAVSTTRVTVNLAPIAFAGRDTSMCLGQSVQLNATGGTSYVWSPITYLNDWTLKNPVVINPPAGNYQYAVTVKDNNGCYSLVSSVVRVNVFSLQVYAGPDAIIQSGQPVQLHAVDINNAGFTSYAWSPAIGLNNPSSQNPIAILGSDMLYTLTAISASGCTAMDDISIKVYKNVDIYVPSAFTPNNDGHNDILKAIPVGIKEFKYLNIFDRAGQLIFRTYDAASGWDGKYNGTPLNGMFVWNAEGIDYKGNVVSKKGTVLIIR